MYIFSGTGHQRRRLVVTNTFTSLAWTGRFTWKVPRTSPRPGKPFQGWWTTVRSSSVRWPHWEETLTRDGPGCRLVSAKTSVQVKVRFIRFRHGKKLNNQFFYLEETISVFSSANNNKRKGSSQDVTPRPMMITYHKNFQSSKYGKKNKSDDVNKETSAETIKLSKMENLPLAWITCRQQNFTSRQNFTCTVFL